ncbi:copper-fist domain-containing protein [Favolaschia claudopus]|uniref:Copper-fist domain-containing protein n=1 Tax=Favolaschia claudopus TaxID=2862362 RepID=A0AAW0EKA4_9AGAR
MQPIPHKSPANHVSKATAPPPAITQTALYSKLRKKGAQSHSAKSAAYCANPDVYIPNATAPKTQRHPAAYSCPRLPRNVCASSTARRYIPIVPALPNGLRDVAPDPSRSLVAPDARQRVDSLLNPCNCRSVWKCKCRAAASSRSSADAPTALNTLANAAALCCTPASAPPNSASTPRPEPPKKRQTSRPNSPTHKRPKRILPAPTPLTTGPSLPPIFLNTEDPSSPSPSIPIFSTMPPISKLTSLAGSGCTCGLECACPGCIEHRGDHARPDRPSCADGCGSCVDAHADLALPGFEASTSILSNSIIEQFLARAAALPAPPSNRRIVNGVDIDPTLVVFPTAGLVNLPKLECCGGQSHIALLIPRLRPLLLLGRVARANDVLGLDFLSFVGI